jgi:hypothetical protein
MMRWAAYAARMGKNRNMYRLLLRKPEGRRPSGRPRFRVDNIMIGLEIRGGKKAY